MPRHYEFRSDQKNVFRTKGKRIGELCAPFLPFFVTDDGDTPELVLMLHVELKIAPQAAKIPAGEVGSEFDQHQDGTWLACSNALEQGHEAVIV